MTTYLQPLIHKHARAGLLLDTNILLLLIVGSYDPSHIPRFKRTQLFAIEDYATLVDFLRHFDQIIVTPNILTEVSNLLGQFTESTRKQVFDRFGATITICTEQYLPSPELVQRNDFHRFGLTDAGIIRISQNAHLVLTDDFRLSQYLQSIGANVINFNHIRTSNWK